MEMGGVNNSTLYFDGICWVQEADREAQEARGKEPQGFGGMDRSAQIWQEEISANGHRWKTQEISVSRGNWPPRSTSCYRKG